MIDYSDLLDDIYDEIAYRWGEPTDENTVCCPNCHSHIHYTFGIWLGDLLWFTCPFCASWFNVAVD